MKTGNRKRVFTAKLLFRESGFLIWNFPGLLKIFVSKHNSKQLYKKIMIVTDAVNGCVYCSWLDAKLAMKSGISEEEIKAMLELQFHTRAAGQELKALLFAQHFAETNGNPEPDVTSGLFAYYGDKTAREIVLAIRATTFGNLYFNTWGALLNRFRGDPAPNSNALFEIIFFLLNSIIVLPIMVIRKLDSKAIGLRV